MRSDCGATRTHSTQRSGQCPRCHTPCQTLSARAMQVKDCPHLATVDKAFINQKFLKMVPKHLEPMFLLLGLACSSWQMTAAKGKGHCEMDIRQMWPSKKAFLKERERERERASRPWKRGCVFSWSMLVLDLLQEPEKQYHIFTGKGCTYRLIGNKHKHPKQKPGRRYRQYLALCLLHLGGGPMDCLPSSAQSAACTIY